MSVLENIAVAADTFSPAFWLSTYGSAIRAGQFLMLRIAETDDPLLGRPLAMYDVVRDASGRAVAVDVVYL